VYEYEYGEYSTFSIGYRNKDEDEHISPHTCHNIHPKSSSKL